MRLWSWAQGNVVAALTILGLVLYGLLRIAYGLFYGPLHVRPEEVGFGYREILTGSLVGVVLVALVAAVATALYIVYYVLLGIVLGGFTDALDWLSNRLTHTSKEAQKEQRRRSRERMRRTRLGRAYLRVAAGAEALERVLMPRRLPRGARFWSGALAFTVVASFAVLFTSAVIKSQDVRRGSPVGPFDLFGAPVLDVQARAVTVTSTPTLEVPHAACLLYLGEANGISVFYAVGKERRAIRVPSSSIVVAGRATKCPVKR